VLRFNGIGKPFIPKQPKVNHAAALFINAPTKRTSFTSNDQLCLTQKLSATNKLHFQGSLGKYGATNLPQEFLDEIETHMSILEVGSGDGSLLKWLRNIRGCKRAQGIDLEKSNLKHQKQGDFLTEDYGRQRFDRILCESTIFPFNNLEEKKYTLSKMEQLLKANGKIQIAICRDAEVLIQFAAQQLPGLKLGRIGNKIPDQTFSKDGVAYSLAGPVKYIEFVKVETVPSTSAAQE